MDAEEAKEALAEADTTKEVSSFEAAAAEEEEKKEDEVISLKDPESEESKE